MFTEGGGMTAVADGGAGGSGGENTGDTQDAGGDESGTETTTSDSDSNLASDTGEAGSTETVEDPDAPIDLGDGRQVPGKWKKLFDAAKENGLDKEVKQLFFGMQRLSQKFPGGIKDAVALADAVEQHGGLDAITQLKTDLESYSQDAELFSSDQKKWIESSFAENEEASLKAFAHSLDYVGEHHPEQYNHLMGAVVLNTLDQGPIHDIYAALTGMKDNPQAQELAQKLAGFYNGIKKFAEKVPEKKVDTERVKLEADRTKLAGEQENLRNHTVNSQTIPLLGRQMTTQLEKEAKAVGFDLKNFSTEQPGAWQALRGEILKRVMAKAASDSAFCKNYKSVLAQGDTTRAVAMMNKKHAAILPDIVREVARNFGVAKKGAGVKSGKGVKPAARGAAPSGNVARVNAKPHASEIDWSKTGNRIYDSVAVLKSGKTVTWA